MPNTINQWVAYLSAKKQEFHDKGTKWQVREAIFFCKYLNLRSGVMSDCSLIATEIHMPNTRNQWFAYLRTDKSELYIKDMKWGARGKRRFFSPRAAARHSQHARVYAEFPQQPPFFFIFPTSPCVGFRVYLNPKPCGGWSGILATSAGWSKIGTKRPVCDLGAKNSVAQKVDFSRRESTFAKKVIGDEKIVDIGTYAL